MADNFDIHAWNRNRLIESTLDDADLKAKKQVDTVFNQIIKDFPNQFETSIEKSQLKFSISTAFVDLSLDNFRESDDPKLGGELEAGVVGTKVEENIDNQTLEQDLKKELEALTSDVSVTMGTYIATGEGYGKVSFIVRDDIDEDLFKKLIGIIESKQYKVDLSQSTRYYENEPGEKRNYPTIKFSWDPKDLDESLSLLQERLKKIFEEKGRSPLLVTKENPKGETDGLDSKTLNKILLKIAKDIKEAKPGLWANINAKKKRGEKPSHGNSDAFKSAVKAGRKINKEK